jgi:hypothetical protein
MFSFSTCRLVLLVSAACNAMTSAEITVNLGDAGHYAILAKTGISTVPSSYVNGDIAVSSIAATAMTGFALTLDSSEKFSKSVQVSGYAFSASYAEPIPTDLTAAVGDMETAYTDAASRQSDWTNIAAGGILAGVTLTPGVYTFGTAVHLTGDITFNGAGVYIIQVTGNLVQDANYRVITSGGAKPENIFWQVAGFVEVGAGATMQGIILGKTKVDFITGSSLIGRVLTQTACNLQMATITEPDTEPIEGSYDLVSSFYLELETANGNPEDEAILNALGRLFVDSYNQLVTEYDDPFERRMDIATVESMTPVRRRLDHPQQESRQLQTMDYLLFLRVSGSCMGCGSDSYYTDQVVRRHRKLDDLQPDEDALLAAYSAGLGSSSGEYGSIVDAVSLYEVDK